MDLFLTADLLMDHLYLAAAEAAPQTTNRISGPPILRNITNINIQVGHLRILASAVMSMFRM